MRASMIPKRTRIALGTHRGRKVAFWSWDLVVSRKDEWRTQPG